MRISIGKSRKDTHWKTVEVSWEKLCNRLSKTHISSETMAEYKAMNKTEKAEKKDIGEADDQAGKYQNQRVDMKR